MRENRLYGSEGGEVKSLPYPYQGPQCDRLGCWRRACCGPWIASSQGLLAMTVNGRVRVSQLHFLILGFA